MRLRILFVFTLFNTVGCSHKSNDMKGEVLIPRQTTNFLKISRSEYANKLHGFWLAQSIGNWTGLITEFDKDGDTDADFYTDDDWGGPDEPNIWGLRAQQSSINFVLNEPGTVWNSDDDTDIEYIYQSLMEQHGILLTGEQIRDGWLAHIYKEHEKTPFGPAERNSLWPWQQSRTNTLYYENKLWGANQRAFHLMQGFDKQGNRIKAQIPPETGDPKNNPNFDKLSSLLTTEIFGLFAPARPDIALKIATLPIQNTARNESMMACEFLVVMHALASRVDTTLSMKEQIFWLAAQARTLLKEDNYLADMYDTVKALYDSNPNPAEWEAARDQVYNMYQLEGRAGYRYATANDAGINFAAAMVSLFYGEGGLPDTIRIAALMGWDSDNPAATWGGLLGFLLGKDGVEAAFGRELSQDYNIHATRNGFPREGKDTFTHMAARGIKILDKAVIEHLGGQLDLESDTWLIPQF